jgi:FixJ family two-component response regulator
MMASEPAMENLTVFVVDDDASIRDSLALMLGLSGYSIRLFADAEDFIRSWDRSWCGCVLADLRLPRMSGLELQAWVRSQNSEIPFVIITAHGDVPAARAAFRAHAVDFLEKPFDDVQLRSAIDSAFRMETRRVAGAASARAESDRLARLTPREREILDHVARGLHAKEIATALHISVRTVEVHKARMMEKLGARNVVELVRFAISTEHSKESNS